MKKLWYYSFFWKEILECDFEEKPKSYKFIKRPSGYNSFVLKENINKAVGDYVFAESKDKLIEVIVEKYNSDILRHEKQICKLKEIKRELTNGFKQR